MPPVLAALSTGDSAIVVAIVLLRLVVPLLIPRFPLVILAALVLDGVDNSLLARFTDADLSADGPYQSWDKALDIYYLAIAYLSTLRNWTSVPAFQVARFLFFYRLVGVFLFELLGARSMLLIFPNTFEFFFILYTVIALRFEPSRWSARFWILAAAALWIVVKLPQEYWIHVAQRDVTDTVGETPLVGVAAAVGVLGVLAVMVFVVRPRLPAPDWGPRLAAAPLATLRAGAPGRDTGRRRLSGVELTEKIGLLALLCIIYAEILPSVNATPLQVTVGVVAVVVANAAISTGYARGGRADRGWAAARFSALLVANLGFVFAASLVLTDDRDFQLGAGLFFAFLITLIVWLYDVYKPLADARFADSPGGRLSARPGTRDRRRGAPGPASAG